MSNLSGLELRKAALEALGWQYVDHKDWPKGTSILDYRYRREWLPPNEQPTRDNSYRTEDLPAIESDPAVSEPMFGEWLKALNKRRSAIITAEIELHSDGSCGILVKKDGGNHEDINLAWTNGRNLSEARARAIVAVGAL